MHNPAAVRINKLFAEAVFVLYRKQRYGIKKCQLTYSPDFLSDIKDLHKRSLELESCDRTFTKACCHETIEEKIKTL